MLSSRVFSHSSVCFCPGDKLLREFEFLVIPRPGFDVPRTKADPTGLKAFGPRLQWMKMPEDSSDWSTVRATTTNLRSPEMKRGRKMELAPLRPC